MLGSVLGAHWGSQATKPPIDWNRLTWQSIEPWLQPPGNPHQSPRRINPDLNSDHYHHPDLSSGIWAISTLPLMLFFHDDALKQQQALIQAMQPWQPNSSTQESLLALGYAIAQACKQQLNPTTLLSEISAYLELLLPPALSPRANHSASWLATTKTLLAEATDLQMAVTAVQQWQRQTDIAGAIALAFYCFLSTPEAWQIAVQRAGHTGDAPSLVTAFTGGLSGAYNSMSGIPGSWLTAYEQTWATAAHSTSALSDLHQQATRLLASWSGSYDVTTVAPLTVAVAAPQVIRPR